MRSFEAEYHLRHSLFATPPDRSEGRVADPGVRVVQLIAGEVMEIAGPLFWGVMLAGVVGDAFGIPTLW